MYSVIVVGTDGSPTAALAVRQAIDLAAAGDGTLHIVSAYRPASSATVGGSSSEQWAIHPRSQVDNILEEAAATARQHGVKAEVYAKRAGPAEAVLKVAKAVRADAIVVGNKGMKGAKRFLLGSIPNKIAQSAPCTVVIAKTT